MADFLDEKRKEIQARLKELKPLVDEYQLLLAADEALGGLGNGTATTTAGGGRARGARTRRRGGGGGGGRRGRPRGGGTRAAQALDLVRDAPGHHHPRARRGDGHPAELPLPRHARPRRGGQGDQVRPRLAPAREASSLDQSPSFATASRSSWSSFTVLVIRSREKSGTSRPCTICHSPFAVVTGNEEMIPSGTS